MYQEYLSMYTVLRYYIKSKLKTLLSKQNSSNNLGEEGLTNRLKVEINIINKRMLLHSLIYDTKQHMHD